MWRAFWDICKTFDLFSARATEGSQTAESPHSSLGCEGLLWSLSRQRSERGKNGRERPGESGYAKSPDER